MISIELRFPLADVHKMYNGLSIRFVEAGCYFWKGNKDQIYYFPSSD